MAGQWFCRIDERELGPLSTRQLRELAAKAVLRPDHLVRTDTSQKWVSASQLRGLFADHLSTDGAIPAGAENAIASYSSGRTWFVRTNSKVHGPFRTAELRKLAASGKLQREHEICESGQDSWHPAHRYQALFPAAPVATARVDFAPGDRQASPAPPSADTAAPKSSTSFLVRMRCPHCQRQLTAKSSAVGRTVNCPACQQPLIIPEPAAAIPAPTAPLLSSPLATTPCGAPKAAPRAMASNDPVEIQTASAVVPVPERLPVSVAKQAWQWIKGTVQEIRDSEELRPPRGRIEFFGPGQQVDLGLGSLDGPMVYATRDRYAACIDASLIELPLAVRSPIDRNVPRLPYWPTYHDATPEQRGVFLKWLYEGRHDPDAELGYVFIYFYGLERRVLVDRQDHLPVIEELLRLLSIYGYSRSFEGYATSLLWLTTALLAETGAMTGELICRILAATTRWTPETGTYFLAACEQADARSLPAELIVHLALPTNGGPTSVIARRQPDKLRALFGARFAQRFPEGLDLRKTSRSRCLDYQPASGTLIRKYDELVWLRQKQWPNIQLARKQANAIVAIWNECIEELRDFDRVAKDAPSSTLTAEMYEALPSELQSGEHPEFSAWQELMQRCADESGRPVVTAGMLAAIKGIAPRASLTKRQCESLLRTADALGLAVEPDVRRGGKSFRWDQKLILFAAAQEAISEIDWHAYESASTLLSLGMQVAQADEDTDEQELQSITRHLERHFSLPEPLQRRLEARVHLCFQGESSDKSIARVLKRTLSVPQRQLIGEFLVEIAIADDTVTDKEVRLLRKLFRQLGLSDTELENQLSGSASLTTVPERAEEAGVSVAISDDVEGDDELVAVPANAVRAELNLERLRKIRSDTVRVREMLHAVLGSDDGLVLAVEPTATPASSMPVAMPTRNADVQGGAKTMQVARCEVANPAVTARFDGLAPEYHAFVAEVCARADWPQLELRDLARGHGLMLAAALEAINDWSMERCGDWLVEENESHAHVNQTLLGKL